MTEHNDRPEQAAALRRRAEEKVGFLQSQELEALSPEETRQALHELQVHQIELEMQNEELRRVREELEASQARYFDLYDLAPIGYWTVSEKGLILEANLTVAALLGVARGALLKQPVSRFIFEEDQDIYYGCRRQLFETGEPQICEFRMLKSDGAVFWVRLQSTTARDQSGKPIGRMTMSDLTEMKLVEKKYRRLQKADSLDRMAGAIAHLFNNQLQVVMGNLELAMGDSPGNTALSEDLMDAMQAATKAAGVCGLMLTYLGQTKGKRDVLHLSETCEQSLPTLRAAVPGNILLECDLPTPGPGVRADAKQIQEVLVNLVTNAWEATGATGGTINIGVKTVSAADISPTFRFPCDWQPEHDAYACLEVRDHGCGIPPADMEKIFDPFFSTRFTGRGLGLAMILGIARAHGGVVTVEDGGQRTEDGGQGAEGSVFRAFFPLTVEEAPRQPERPAELPTMVGDGGTVLVIEDDPMVRKLTADMIELLGFKVLEAVDGVEGVEIFKAHQGEVRCVICDVRMPRMDGWETLSALRELWPGIPVILASGYDEAVVMAGEHTEQPQEFLKKPFGLKNLRNAISGAIPGRFKKRAEVKDADVRGARLFPDI